MKNTLLFTLLSFLSISLFAQSNPAITNSIVENHLYHTNNGQGRGYYEGANLITKEVFFNKLNNIPIILDQYKTGQSMEIGGTLLIGAGVGLAVAFLIDPLPNFSVNLGSNTSSSSRNTGGGRIIAGVFFTALGTGIIVAGGRQKRKAINAYNESMSRKVDLSLGMGNNGLGLFVSF